MRCQVWGRPEYVYPHRSSRVCGVVIDGKQVERLDLHMYRNSVRRDPS